MRTNVPKAGDPMQFPSEEEQLLIKSYLLLPLIITVLERDKKVIATSSFKTKQPYIQLLDKVINRTEQDFIATKKDLYKTNIRIYQQTRTNAGIEFKYLYKGYHHQSMRSWDVIKYEITETMEAYFLEPYTIKKTPFL
jgi:hypothetical protein